jgi:hypothetical protein
MKNGTKHKKENEGRLKRDKEKQWKEEMTKRSEDVEKRK